MVDRSVSGRKSGGTRPLSDEVLDAVPEAIFTIDASGAVLYLNRAAQQMFALDPASVGERTLADLVVVPGAQTGVDDLTGERLLKVLAQGRKIRGIRSDGAQFPIEVAAIRSSDAPPRYTAFIHDTTATREDDRRRTRMDRLLNNAEELAAIGSYEIDLRTQEVTWSDALYHLYGYRPGELEVTVEHILARLHPDEHDEHRALTAQMFKSPYPAMREYRIQLDDGAIRHLVAKNSIERDDDDTPIRLFGVVQDVTEQRLTERELQAHHALTQALGEWHSFEQGVVDLLRRLGRAIDCDAAGIWVRADRGDSLVCRAFWAHPSAELGEFEQAVGGAEIPPGESVVRRAWDLMEPIGINDASAESLVPPGPAALNVGLRSVLLFPAVHHGETLAVLAFHGTEPRRLTARLIRTLCTLGHDLGRFLAGRRAEIGFSPLSARELEVLQLAAQGMSGPVIAERLVIGPATVKTHFEHIYEKLDVTDRTAAVAEAMRQGLIG